MSKLEQYFHRPDTYASQKYIHFWESVVVTPRSSSIEGAFVLHVRGKTIYMHPRTRGEMICRITVIFPSAGEPYYLRLFLQHRTPRNFVDARTVEGSIFSQLYEPLQYPLFYVHGTGGWHFELKSKSATQQKVSQTDYYRCLLLSQKENGSNFNRFQLLGRLLNEWVLEMCSRMEDQHLLWIRNNQTKIVNRK